MMFFALSLLIISVIVIIAIIAPKEYVIKRSIIIDRPYIGVFRFLKFIKNQDYWSPWKKKDLNMKQEFFGVDGEVGFIAKWEGNDEVGKGEQEITFINENDVVETELRFEKPWKSISKAIIKVEDFGLMQTKVSWIFSGYNKFPSNLFMLFYNMDKVVGKDFEEGLKSLKALLEKE
ncbi:SRPBCC family protein [Gaetbulibacter sp. M235]|uniref:SRPBCC family protein n=1 Tax=Gaetbulibacter sp. M235 TaxID=3126510 RepID=UPI00374F8012